MQDVQLLRPARLHRPDAPLVMSPLVASVLLAANLFSSVLNNAVGINA